MGLSRGSCGRFITTICVLAQAGCVGAPAKHSAESSSPRRPSAVDGVKIVVKGGDERVIVPSGAPARDSGTYDVVVIGAGLAGLSSAVYLTDAGLRVLVLEKEAHLGGLAAFTETASHTVFDRGAAYWTDAYEEEKAILDHIGLSKFHEKNEIPEPIDSYLVRGHFYPGIWDRETLEKLPASFDLFKFQLQMADADGQIPNQPFEEFEKYGGKMTLDALNTKQWIDSMPAELEASLPQLESEARTAKESTEEDVEKNPKFALSEARRILERYKREGSKGMADVIELMDLYCRSALGSLTGDVSAMAFANFYISEITTRYTSPQGTGLAADNMYRMLSKRPRLAAMKTNSPVWKVVSGAQTADVYYASGGKNRIANTRYVVFAAQLKLAPKMIEGFASEAPAQAKMMSEMGYAHYSVHNVYLDGHPYRATYDTWLRGSAYSDDDPTDVILGRWMDPKMFGYEGYRDFSKDPGDREGILSIYHPLTPRWLAAGAYSEENAKEAAREATEKIESTLSRLPDSLFRGPLVIKKIETSRWPLSVHVATPGHYTFKARLLRKPFRRVFFANNNLGTPAFEEALFRGHCAADNVLVRMKPKFQLEKWTRCPIDAEEKP